MAAHSDESSVTGMHPIGRLYGQWAFNFIIDIACAIADDFTERPQHYRAIDGELTSILSGFRSQMGSHPDWPDAHQRISIFRMLGTACLASIPLREAGLICVEAGTEVNRDVLTEAFNDAAESFRHQLITLEGHSLEFGCRQIDTIFDNAIKLLRSEEIMRVFNLAPAPDDARWPLSGTTSGEGTNLATELIRALDSGTVARALLGGPRRELGVPTPIVLRTSMTQNKFILLQQAAWYGGSAISKIMAGRNSPMDLRNAVGDAYKWAKALQRLIPDVVRTWKDPDYRMRLTDIEWGMIEPHPSGDIALAMGIGSGSIGVGFGGFGFSTATVRGEVCCSTGDLQCASSSNCQISPGPSCINCGSLAVVLCRALATI
jgi:hypothetical protein